MTALNGRKIALTRDEFSSETGRILVEKMGGIPIVSPMIQIEPSGIELDACKVNQLKECEWIIFTSKNGVQYFYELIQDARREHLTVNKKIGAVGKKTAEALSKAGVKVDYIPPFFSAASFAEDFKENIDGPVLFPQGNLSRGEIAKFLTARGNHCFEWTVYQNVIPEMTSEMIFSLKQSDTITFFSPSAVENFYEAVCDDHEFIDQIKIGSYQIASIGPTTTHALQEKGLPVHIQPSEYTIEAMMLEIVASLR
ncbi:uroporphyrinogen-III synthase [Jeotgalibacillus salarius]|uniref:Uroporphyrinogen-III synthase n=1 Tax=Jeotgalibacillus salarius TaxID=546023 RepID=A0A4Y8LG05_9BACL|nr:uroporphyrinogen-III synthase [Jeotgalibacillus salarius]TFE01000.1 uroporphyrinogen-III synthase [Jeotgalibacillus salarius]